ncbi:hypothetical protein DPMN_106872 [Dreissena polymorpha]|uniref:Uncharacterized protein n=1 Tax=Dreissena polymorpha TaxID=45954 RepID=A0A9D4K5V5_DREPO|nr:hypothetical protein DPMN_106872 [Dreissena polymorpha]
MNKQEGLKGPNIGTNIVTKIHEDRKINVTSRVLTMKNAPPPGSHVFQPIVTIFELIQDIIETYVLATFYEDWNINVASTELTRQMLTAHDGHKAITKAHHEHWMRPSDREFVGSLPTRGAISLSPPQTPSTGSSQDSTMPSCNIEVNVKLLPGF